MTMIPHTLPFGRYRGRPLTELPSDYVEWALALDHLREPLKSRLRAEVQRPGLYQPSQLSLHARVAKALIMAGIHALAQHHHPDVGGEHEMTVRITVAADWRQARGLPS
jgi:Putative quorum-sensing-regulated virulence factor